MANDWRALDLGATAWFDTPTQSDAARLASRVIAQATDPRHLLDLDIRPGGIRIGVGRFGQLTAADLAMARSVSVAADELGLTADPAVLQDFRLTLDALDPSVVEPFWAGALGYESDEIRLIDPVRRDPPLRIRPMDTPRPLRDRIHLDISRPGEKLIDAAMAAGGRHLTRSDGNGPYGDPEGNEADLVPGWSLGDDPDYADWDVVFGAMVAYRTDRPSVSTALITSAAELTDVAGLPLLIDYRPDPRSVGTDGLVIIDTGKDGWEDERFADLARGIQSAARRLGLSPERSAVRFVQFGIAVADVAALREFWRVTLGYVTDPRPVTDIYDPRRLNPPLFFQQIDTTEVERLKQRNRLHLDVVVAQDQLPARIDAAVAAGGVISRRSEVQCMISDPEGNEIEFIGVRSPIRPAS